MNFASFLLRTPNRRIGFIALLVLALDQITKVVVVHFLGYDQEKTVINGFFKFVYWRNTGAAWSLFHDSNALLAAVAVTALVILFLFRRHFDTSRWLGRLAFGLVLGGIMGNLIDRLRVGHVIDFIYFYWGEHGFPAFNVADSAICTGVGLIFLMTWKSEYQAKKLLRAAQDQKANAAENLLN